MSKVIVITGGCGNFGDSIAEFFKSKDNQVILIDNNVEEINKRANDYNVYNVDITNEDEVVNCINKIVEKYKKIDVLVNNAGIIHSKLLVNITNKDEIRHSYNDFKKVIDVNLNGTFLVTSVVAENMIMNRVSGCIINISSISANGNIGQSAYSASKAGVSSMTKVWSKELGIFGIRVNAIAPGFIETNSTKHALSEEIINQIKHDTPLKKLGNPDNIVKSIEYIIENDFINGAIVDVNGGLTI